MRIAELVAKYNYSPLPPQLSIDQRKQYLEELPSNFKLEGNNECEIFSYGIKLSEGYDRIVIGDYGAYLEIAPERFFIENIEVTPGEEYRLKGQYRNTIKYLWYCPKGHPEIKIYAQLHRVKYADYKPGYFYISPFEVSVKEKNNV